MLLRNNYNNILPTIKLYNYNFAYLLNRVTVIIP